MEKGETHESHGARCAVPCCGGQCVALGARQRQTQRQWEPEAARRCAHLIREGIFHHLPRTPRGGVLQSHWVHGCRLKCREIGPRQVADLLHAVHAHPYAWHGVAWHGWLPFARPPFISLPSSHRMAVGSMHAGWPAASLCAMPPSALGRDVEWSSGTAYVVQCHSFGPRRMALSRQTRSSLPHVALAE